MPSFTDYKIAAGWNNAGSLALISGITATSNIKFADPSAQHNYRPGKIILRLDGLTTEVGINAQEWLMGLTFEQYRYLQTTYCAGGYSGKVTIRTRWQNNSYANYNAIIHIPTENLNNNLTGYSNVSLLFTDLVAI